MDGIAFLIFLAATALVVIDYGMAGRTLLKIRKNPKTVQRFGPIVVSFLRREAYLLFTVVAFAAVPLTLILLSSAITLEGFLLLMVSLGFMAICIISVIGRRRWRNEFIKPIIESSSDV
jgi:hypothetical protein